MADLSALPRVDDLIDAADELVAQHGRTATASALRAALDRSRRALLDGRRDEVPNIAEVVDAAGAALAAVPRPPRRVINATGVIVHTNLGRAPLSAAAVAAVVEAAGYCDVEIDLATGQRGSRGAAVDPLICAATGAEAAMAVNNAAAALVLVLAALAGDREVCVSRGELVEIGGSFRLPDIMAASGTRLVEVGTTNRTRADDYTAGGDVAALLKVHPSNYAVVGFTHSPSTAEVASVARARGVPLVFDVGSGLLSDDDSPWLAGETSVAHALDDGADLVICSGDKLLGGPQAGLIAGRADLVEACRRHPLARALRLDKLRIAGLAATLADHVAGRAEDVPVTAMARADTTSLRARSQALAAACGGTVIHGRSVLGGGTAPGAEIDSPVITLDAADPDAASAALRTGEPPIVARIRDDRIVIDLRCVDPADDDVVAHRLSTVT